MKNAIEKLKQNIANENYIVPVWAQQELVDELEQLEKFKNLAHRIASVRMDTDTIIREAKQCIADYEDHLFMEETSRDLFAEIDRMERGE